MNIPLVYRLFCQGQCRVAKYGRDNRWMHLSGKPPSKQGIPIKIVVDDHVDRCGVEAPWGVKLTHTNNLIDFLLCVCLILLMAYELCLKTRMLNYRLLINDGVIIAFWHHPIPFRTRTWNKNTPMVLQLKLRKSRSLPHLLSVIYWQDFQYAFLLLPSPFLYLIPP